MTPLPNRPINVTIYNPIQMSAGVYNSVISNLFASECREATQKTRYLITSKITKRYGTLKLWRVESNYIQYTRDVTRDSWSGIDNYSITIMNGSS